MGVRLARKLQTTYRPSLAAAPYPAGNSLPSASTSIFRTCS